MRPAAQCLESSPKSNAARRLGACRQGHTGSSPDRPGLEEEGVGCHVHIGSCGSPRTSGQTSRKRPAPSPAAVMPPSPTPGPEPFSAAGAQAATPREPLPARNVGCALCVHGNARPCVCAHVHTAVIEKLGEEVSPAPPHGCVLQVTFSQAPAAASCSLARTQIATLRPQLVGNRAAGLLVRLTARPCLRKAWLSPLAVGPARERPECLRS